MAKSQNSKFKCFSGILHCICSLPTQPSDPTTDIPTTTTTYENPKKNFKTQARTPGVVARLVGLESLRFPKKISSQRDGKPYEHRSNRKDSMAQQECKDEYEVLETSKVERSSYPTRRTINSKLSEAEMARTFGQALECLDNENFEHLAMMERLLGPLPQPFMLRNISRGVHAWIG
ncbi:unnamed protein product [Camellia sinensis]